MLRGDLGQPPGGCPEALAEKALKGEPPITARPGALLPAAISTPNAPRPRKRARQMDDELASYLMYPKVFADFAARRRMLRRGLGAADAGLLLWHAAGDEIADRDRAGQVARDPLSGGQRYRRRRPGTVFFELNGQPRNDQGPQPPAVATRAARRKAEEGNDITSPRRCRAPSRRSRSAGQRSRRATSCHPRGDEDGDRAARAEGWEWRRRPRFRRHLGGDAKDLLVILADEGVVNKSVQRCTIR